MRWSSHDVWVNCGPPNHVADRIDARCARPVVVVDRDEALVVQVDATRLAAEVVRVRPAPDRGQEVRADDLAPILERDAGAAVLPRDRSGDARPEQELDPLCSEHRLERLRYVRILAIEEVRSALHDRHRRPEAAEHLRELAADVAAAEDDEVRRELIQLHDAVVVEPGDPLDALDRRRDGASAHVDDHHVPPVPLARDVELALPHEPGVAGDEAKPLPRGGEFPFESLAPLADDGVLARDDGREVHADDPGVHAQPAGRARHVRCASARDERLGRGAAVVHTGPAHPSALDEEHAASRAREALRERAARLPGTDDDRVHVHASPPFVQGAQRSARGFSCGRCGAGQDSAPCFSSHCW